jgi:hypothetical protein
MSDQNQAQKHNDEKNPLPKNEQEYLRFGNPQKKEHKPIMAARPANIMGWPIRMKLTRMQMIAQMFTRFPRRLK